MPQIIQIHDLDQPALQLYAQRRENELKHACEPAPGYFIAESMKVIRRALAAGYEPVSFLCEERYIEEIQNLVSIECSRAVSVPARMECQAAGLHQTFDQNIIIYAGDSSVLEQIAGYHLTGGALALLRRRVQADPDEFLSNNGQSSHAYRRIAVLEHVVNPTNLGAIVRSAAALGMDAVLFSPDCADPLYRRAIRVSMGTIFQIPWTFAGTDPDDWYCSGVKKLREAGWHTVAMALREDSAVPDDPRFQTYEKLAVIVGTEGEGLADETIRQCDDTVMIPMTHGVDSLNVGAAAAVAFWNFGIISE
ncbi:MAG: RNA methyltransferase [Eubacterium sp.]|nr:RNA methyltransferase [Eubacterium sp.]